MKDTAEKLLKTISGCTSPFHASHETAMQLEASGFRKLEWEDSWDLAPGNSYYTSPFGTTLFAFRVNPGFKEDFSLRIAASHIDSPSLRIKAKPEHFQGDYMKVNTEVYGGAILPTWFDRPLSIAGRVYLKGKCAASPEMKLIDFARPLLIIPNLSIHMNRSVNEGIALNRQIDLLPVAGVTPDKDASQHFITDLIANELNIDASMLLSYDLCVYNIDHGCIAGINCDFLMAPRIDNISSVQACIYGITNSGRNGGLDLAAFFDHEEVGSNSNNGASSNLLPFVLERIYSELGLNRQDYIRAITGGYCLSLDAAHATNPNHPEKSDITSGIQINDGIALKSTSKNNYCGDAETNAILLSLANEYNIPLSANYLRSDETGGSTLGSLLSSVLPMKCADIGIPLFAMHSAMETAGVADQYHLELFTKVFFEKL